jgi:hypothetical protein
MNRVSLNTALMSFAFTGVLAPHRAPEVSLRSRQEATLRAHTLRPESGDSLGRAVERPAERAARPESVWVGALPHLGRG